MIIRKSLFSSVSRMVELVNIVRNSFRFLLTKTSKLQYVDRLNSSVTLFLKKSEKTEELLCDVCMLCYKVCPTKCIEISKGEENFPVEFKFISSKCIFCNACVEACPSSAIEFKRCKNVAKTRKEGLSIDLCKLSK